MPILDNPYTPSAGARPRRIVGGAEAEVEAFAERLLTFDARYRNTLLTGVRGTGKTTLLNEFQTRAAELGWVVSRRRLKPGLNKESDVAQAFSADARSAADDLSGLETAKRMFKNLREGVSIEVPVPDVGRFAFRLAGSGDRTTLEDALLGALRHLGRVAQRTQGGVVFIYDETQYVFDRPDDDQHPLSAILGAFTAMAEEELPVALVLAGLPSTLRLVSMAQQNAARSFDQVELGPLSTVAESGRSSAGRAAAEIAAAGGINEGGATTPFELEPAAAEQLAMDSGGYLAGIQALGAGLVETAYLEQTTLLCADLYAAHRDELIARRDRELYVGELQRTHARYRPLLYAAAAARQPFSSDELALTVDDSEALLDDLEHSEVLHQPEPNRYAFTYGGFEDFLRRQPDVP